MEVETFKEYKAKWMGEEDGTLEWVFFYEVKVIARNRGKDSVSPLGADTHKWSLWADRRKDGWENEWVLSVHTYVSEHTKMGESSTINRNGCSGGMSCWWSYL